VLVRSAETLAGDGLWGAARQPCWFVASLGDRRDNAALASLRAESQILLRLAGVPGVPRLLHVDIGAGLMVQSRAPEAALRSLLPSLQG
jgi:hypothetical protein